jgi:predicted PurR-regulated permease PerM
MKTSKIRTTPSEEITIKDESDSSAGTKRQVLRRMRAAAPLAVIAICLMGLVGFLSFARTFLMPVVIAMLLNFLLKPIVRGLARVGISEALGAIVVMLLVLGSIPVLISRLAEPASGWAARAPESLRQVETKIRHLLRPAAQLSKAAQTVENFTKAAAEEPTTAVEVKDSHLTDFVFTYTKSFLAGAIETVVLLYFLLAAGDLFMQKLAKVLPTSQDKQKALEIAHEVQHNISTFLLTITLINTCLGVLVGFAMVLVGMPNAVLWGVLAGLLNFIPYFGPIIGVAVLVLAGLVSFDSVGLALLPPILYFTLHALESNFVTPMILGRRLTMNPVVIFLSLMFWTWLWGITGALLSIPMLMILKVFCDNFKALAPVGEFLSG